MVKPNMLLQDQTEINTKTKHGESSGLRTLSTSTLKTYLEEMDRKSDLRLHRLNKENHQKQRINIFMHVKNREKANSNSFAYCLCVKMMD